MANQPDDYLSTLDQHVLLAIIRLMPDAYGLSIRDEISARTEREFPVGTVYASLERLEDKGFINSKEGEPTSKRGGRRKMFFSLTGIGRGALSRSLQDTDKLRDGLSIGGLATCNY